MTTYPAAVRIRPERVVTRPEGNASRACSTTAMGTVATICPTAISAGTPVLPSPAASHATSPAQKRGPVLTRYPAAYLADRLGKDFGPDRVFRDADALVPGLPWPDGLDRALADARVLVVLIGPGWLDAPGPDGSGRALDRPDDWVRREIRTALTREIPVVPVLLDDTARPAVSDPCRPSWPRSRGCRRCGSGTTGWRRTSSGWRRSSPSTSPP